MAIDATERHNLIMKAGEVQGLATALVSMLAAGNNVFAISPATTAQILEQRVTALKESIFTELGD